MLFKILVAVAAVILVFVVVVAMRPSESRIVRTATISSPVSAVFPHVNDLHKWQAWSPWARMDPAAKVTYEGPTEGTGAVFSWAGNNKVGEGKMTLTESRRNELIRFKLDFLKPFAASNIAEFTFKPEGNQTLVTWTMTGKNNFLFKAVGLFMDCDKMVGAQFEDGFANLKTVIANADRK